MIDRRTFLKTMTAISATLATPLWRDAFADTSVSDKLGQLLPLRPLGDTGEKITMLGVGGHHIGGEMSEKECQATIEAAIEGGVRFFDSAEGYQDGGSERRLGKYLVPKYREHVFLMTKCEQKNKNDAQISLDASLKRLNTDYLDLWQMHTLESTEDVEERIEGGMLDAMLEAKESGKVRYIGFTGHATPDTHTLMLERTQMFHTCQMPVNVCDTWYKSFISTVLPTLMDRNMAVLAMKTLGEGAFFKKMDFGAGLVSVVPDLVSVKEALFFAWSLPVSTVITGADNAEMMKENIQLAKSFTKIGESERQKLIQKVADIATTGKFEDYKYGDFSAQD